MRATRWIRRGWLAAVLWSGATFAQSATPPSGTVVSVSPEKKDEARKRYEKGRAAETAGNLKEAYDAYKSAYGLYPHWQIAGALGHVAEQLGYHAEAAQRVAQFLREAEGLGSVERNEKDAEFAKARALVSAVEIQAPAGAEVFVDGQSIGKAPIVHDVFVDPGLHEVQARKAGEKFTQTVNGDKSRRYIVKVGINGSVTVVPTATSPTPTPTETATATTPPIETTAPTVTAAGSSSSGPTATTSAGGADKPSSARNVIAVAGGMLTLGGLVVGGVSVGAFVDQGTKAAANRENTDGSNAIGEANFKNLAFWSFTAAAVVGGATLTYYLLSKPKGPETNAGFFVVPGSGGVVVQGRF